MTTKKTKKKKKKTVVEVGKELMDQGGPILENLEEVHIDPLESFSLIEFELGAIGSKEVLQNKMHDVLLEKRREEFEKEEDE